MRFHYPVEMEKIDGGVAVRFPDLPEADGWGVDDADALEDASDRLEDALETRLKDNEPIPRPSPAGGRRTVAFPPELPPSKPLPDHFATIDDVARAFARIIARGIIRDQQRKLAEAVAARMSQANPLPKTPDLTE